MKIQKYKATGVNGKTYEGWPVKSYSDKIFLILFLDDYDEKAIRFGYIEIVPESLGMID